MRKQPKLLTSFLLPPNGSCTAYHNTKKDIASQKSKGLNMNTILKNISIQFLVALAIASSASAQHLTGGFGTFFVGAAYNACSSLQDNLSSENLLGSGASTNAAGLVIGGSGFALRPNGWLLGGSGFTYNISTTTNQGTGKLVVGGGFFDVGYAVIRGENMFAYPYFGVGGAGATMKISNKTSNKVLSFGGDPIYQGTSAAYTAGGMAFETGFSVRFVFDDFSDLPDTAARVGLIFGLDGGAVIFPSFGKWQNFASEDFIESYSTPFFFAPYIRATIGISVFKH
jgi:hypothetical protein